MNPLERQLSTLLRAAPGDPPAAIDADALLARAPRRRRRYLPPALAAAAVVAIAVPVGLALTHDSGTTQAGPRPAVSTPARPRSTVSTLTPHPKAAAMRDLEQLLDRAPLPAGAQRLGHGVAGIGVPFGTASPNDLDRARFFTAPGTAAAALAYLKTHPLDGMTLDFSGSSSGGGTPAVESVTFVSPAKLYLSYSVAPYRGGAALRVDAQTTWVPNRPRWAFVPDSVTSADVTVIRTAFNAHPQGAPTVRRTLTGTALRRLADAVNGLPSAAPEGVHSCPAALIRSVDLVAFHTPTGDLRVSRNGGGCAFNATITSPPSKRHAYVAGTDFTAAVLSALGLPANYGYR